jgi:DNA polymerase III subunit alpha
MTDAKAQAMWKLIEPFAAYGFNKAHAASYGRVAYQTAYMKANFPAAYMSAVLTADSGDVEKIGETIAECKRMGMPVLAPHLNESFEDFTVVKNPDTPHGAVGGEKIRFGLNTIKNFGEGIAHAIVEERKKHGAYKSLSDFLERVTDKNLNKKSLEALVKAGALDEINGIVYERGTLLANLETMLAYHKEMAADSGGHESLFGDLMAAKPHAHESLRLEPAPAIPPQERLAWEKELLGLYISGHPLDKHREKLAKHETTIKKVREEYKQGMNLVIAGILEEVRELLTKKGDKMAFLKIADFTGPIEAVIFPKAYEEYGKFLKPDACIAVKGSFSLRNDAPSIIVEKVKEL